MKRAISIIMAAGMAALAVTGCGGGSTTQTTSAPTTAASGETTSGETTAQAEKQRSTGDHLLVQQHR